MIASATDVQEIGTIGSLHPTPAMNRLGIGSLLLLSAWCGLVAGLLEVGTIVLRKQVFDPDHLYKMSRHFVWLIPVSNLCVFLALGLFGCGVILVWPRRGRWLFARVLCAMTLLPTILVAFPRIYSAGLVGRGAGGGGAACSALERQCGASVDSSVVSFPVAFAIVVILGAWLWVGDWIKQARERARPLPPPGSPNILLIVMDTVAAGHLSLHGYDRATSTDLGRARRARHPIRFRSGGVVLDASISCDHVYGRWLHELSVGWLTPLDRTHPTLAEFLGDRGYATAGFVANTPIVAAILGWPAASRITGISSSPSSPRSSWPCSSVEPWTVPDDRLFH